MRWKDRAMGGLNDAQSPLNRLFMGYHDGKLPVQVQA